MNRVDVVDELYKLKQKHARAFLEEIVSEVALKTIEKSEKWPVAGMLCSINDLEKVLK